MIKQLHRTFCFTYSNMASRARSQQPAWLLFLSIVLFLTLVAVYPHRATAQTESDATHGFDQTRYYTIRPGDTLFLVALEIGIDLEETNCLVAPDFTWDQPLVVGDVLEVPPASVQCHEVMPGETLASIADLYETTPTTIASIRWNNLSDFNVAAVDPSLPLPVGLHLRVPPLEQSRAVDLNTATTELAELLAMPADTIPFLSFAVGGPEARQYTDNVPSNWPYGSGYFSWPVSGWLSQGFHAGHRAVDIASPLGTRVRAADRGVVIRAGWNGQGYGNMVVIDHKIDYITLYGHLSEIYVQEGDIVGAGALIGAIGSTGNSTGPHLHFEVRDFGHLTDPLVLLAE